MHKTREKPEDAADGLRVVARNRKARHNYHILDTFEAGLALTGNEVKSVREGGISLAESYARPRDGELFLVGCHIAPYENTGFDLPEPDPPLDFEIVEISRSRNSGASRARSSNGASRSCRSGYTSSASGRRSR